MTSLKVDRDEIIEVVEHLSEYQNIFAFVYLDAENIAYELVFSLKKGRSVDTLLEDLKQRFKKLTFVLQDKVVKDRKGFRLVVRKKRFKNVR